MTTGAGLLRRNGLGSRVTGLGFNWGLGLRV